MIRTGPAVSREDEMRIYACYNTNHDAIALSRNLQFFADMELFKTNGSGNIYILQIDSLSQYIELLLKYFPKVNLIDIDSIDGGEAIPSMLKCISPGQSFVACVNDDIGTYDYVMGFGYNGVLDCRRVGRERIWNLLTNYSPEKLGVLYATA